MIEQFFLATLSLGAVFFSQCSTDKLRRFACISGLLAQPFWFHTTWEAGQYTLFGLSVVYTLNWMRGAYNFWWRQHAV